MTVLVKGHEYVTAWSVPQVLPKAVFIKLMEASGFSDVDAYTQDDVEDAHGTAGNRDNLPAEFSAQKSIPNVNLWALGVWTGPDGADASLLVGGVPNAGLLSIIDYTDATKKDKGGTDPVKPKGGGGTPTKGGGGGSKPKKGGPGTPEGETRPKLLAFVGLGLATAGAFAGGWFFSRR